MGDAPFGSIPNAQTFADYFTQTWLDGPFSITLWNHWGEDQRTINAVEGWHSKINDTVSRAHPNIFKAIDQLKKEQEAVEVKLLQLSNGAPSQPKKRKYITLEQRLARVRARFLTDEINLRQFADAVGNLFMF